MVKSTCLSSAQAKAKNQVDHQGVGGEGANRYSAITDSKKSNTAQSGTESKIIAAK
jgi:hypothetical protein